MKNVINGINHWIHTLPNEYNSMSAIEISNRPSPNKWSKKEILGHLCDSAINNIERFVKIQYEEQPYVMQSYNQEQWMVVQNYQERPLDEILTLFQTLNKQIINIIMNTPTEKLTYLCDIGNNHQKTLEWLIQDYLEHMEHHINNQILIKNND
ncbi:DinB family protein [Bacillus sp. sid0103]|uniref:DinB family protein n=1 Tax=Bacillus sp. sid0103 TaxID=2856337 RepID=UPI001C44D73B|nr:DinB family protein [Bacillus sp. sid0103]MBV7509788.1 DinB family protein [Bacillus sp. sid0103]